MKYDCAFKQLGLLSLYQDHTELHRALSYKIWVWKVSNLLLFCRAFLTMLLVFYVSPQTKFQASRFLLGHAPELNSDSELQPWGSSRRPDQFSHPLSVLRNWRWNQTMTIKSLSTIILQDANLLPLLILSWIHFWAVSIWTKSLNFKLSVYVEWV